jgi:hypothetical protein
VRFATFSLKDIAIVDEVQTGIRSVRKGLYDSVDTQEEEHAQNLSMRTRKKTKGEKKRKRKKEKNGYH